MNFKKIDVASWRRKEYYEHYRFAIPCTYSITVNMDISKIMDLKMKLYPTMLYAITAVVNRHEEFRTAIGADSSVGVFGQVHPSYTIFHKESELFSNMWTEFSEDYDIFCDRYKNDLKLYGAAERMEAKPNTPENTFPISMFPWITFAGFNLNLQKGYDYLLPIFTMGKFFESNGKTLLPLSMQVHHAVCDGFHVSRFIAQLQDKIVSITPHE